MKKNYINPEIESVEVCFGVALCVSQDENFQIGEGNSSETVF